eukprot:TRINITY_DN8679_c0_g1_i6.p1 TRINITY_DN8679_c0_g1~~TRINITY_DN8679_c0_g1_i6.p1  ORF type:complete len:138 (+),score=19.77 TRINITY_DN8679_c0_g1_i6:693-1106(+)
MMTRKTLFPGEHYIDQINKIIDVCGIPDAEAMALMTNEYAKKYVSEIPFKHKIPLNTLIKYENPLAIDLLEKMLEFNPKKRITAQHALLHPYFEGFHDPADEPVFTGVMDFSFENNPTLTFPDVAQMILYEIQYVTK